MRNRKLAIVMSAVCCCALGLTLAACVPNSQTANEASDTSASNGALVSEKDHSSMAAVDSALEQQYAENAPEVRTLEDGTRVQLTPTVTGAYWHLADEPSSYNTYYLNSDNRGCVSCHKEGLANLVENELTLKHVQITNNLGTDVQPMDCEICHDQGTGYFWTQQQFGTLIHGIHSKDTFSGNCMSCHTATNGTTMQLWEEAKYDVLQGITFFENSEFNGDFKYDQTTTNDMYTVDWLSGDTNQEMIDKDMRGVPTDDETFDNWEITVSGLVDNPYTIKLGDLIAQAPTETFVSSTQCVMNASGGELVSNVECKGIPIQWLLDKAGVQANAVSVFATASDGWSRGETFETAATHEGYLVYEVNGQRLTWSQGFPVRAWYKGRPVPSSIRWTSELEVSDDPKPKTFEGWQLDETNALTSSEIGANANKPNCGILHFHEGQIIEAGKPYTFEGYGSAFGQKIKAIELSFDNGKTWKTFDTSDTDAVRWIHWNFTYTPEEPGAYVLSARAVLEDGSTALTCDKVMFNAK